LSSSETVTVGAGGAGGGSGASGSIGGTSSFGAHVSASGGGGGTAGVQSVPPFVAPDGGNGGVGTVGDLRVSGSGGDNPVLLGTSTTTGAIYPAGGDGHLGAGLGSGRGQTNGVSPTVGYGGGARGSTTVTNNARSGADGRQGIVIVELLY
jgi:hypothetical protein